MAATISREGTTATPITVANSDMGLNVTGRVSVVRTVVLNVGAGQDDKTLYTVPDGKDFYLLGYYTTKQDGPGSARLYDSTGDTPSGAVKLIVFFTQKTYPPYHVEIPHGIKFTRGITVEGSDITASKDTEYTFYGYLV